MSPAFDGPNGPLDHAIPIGHRHQLVANQLDQRVVNRDFTLAICVRRVEGSNDIDFERLAHAVDEWLATLDPDMRFGEPRLTVRSGSTEVVLRAHGKPALLRGGKSLVENSAPGFPLGRRTAEVRRCA